MTCRAGLDTDEIGLYHAKAGEGGETQTLQERKHTTTQPTCGAHQKGNQTELAEPIDLSEWRTSRRGQGTPRQGNPLQAPRGTRGRNSKGQGATRSGAGPALLTCREHRADINRTLHPRRQYWVQRHTPTLGLGSLRTSPWGSQWQQASSTGLAAPKPRKTKHQGRDVVGKRLQSSC